MHFTSFVVTRWNSNFRQLRSIMHLDPKKLEGVLRSCGHENLLLTGREGSQLEEVVNILAPFLEAIDVTQDESCTMSVFKLLTLYTI
jgi:hypothetical protein